MNRIRRLREELKLSQNDLGKKLNKTQQQISLYENGTNELDIDSYIILSKLFNCSIEYIAGKSNIRYSLKNNDFFKEQFGITEEEYMKLSDKAKNDIKNFIEFMNHQKNKDTK